MHRLQSSRRVHANLADAARASLTQQAFAVLRVLGDGGARPVADLARAAEMDAGAVSRQLKLLDDEGLVRRRTSPSHGSVVLVEATAAGRRAAERLSTVRDRHLQRALADWSTRDREELGRLLARLVEELQRTPYASDDH